MDAAHLLLKDILPELLTQAREAKAFARGRERDPMDTAFLNGRSEAYYEVLSIFLRQLEAFGIDREAVRLPRDLDLEREFLGAGGG